MTAFEQAWESLTPDLETPVEGSAITFEPSMSSNDECCEEAKANFLYRLSQIWADGESPVGFDLDDRFYTTYADKIGFNSPEWGQMTCENFRKTLEDLAADSIPDPKYGDVDWVKEIGFADERDGWGGFPPTMGFPKAQAATRQLAKDILREWDACSNAQLDDMGAVDMDENAIDEQRARDMDGASAFSKAYGVLKRYTPGWRSEARNLLDLSPDDHPHPMWPEQDSDENQEHPLWLGGGSKVGVYEHPYDSEYVVKVPYIDSQYDLEAFKSRNENDEIIALLESLGYPIVGELDNWDRVDDATDAYSVQPRLVGSDLDDRFLHPFHATDEVNARWNTAHQTLAHLINDRHRRNWGKDESLGTLRNFDVDSIGGGDDWWPHKRTGERLQERLDQSGIQHPVSRLLDEIPQVNHADRDDPLYQFQPFRRLLEEIEPHSENPKNLTVDGKPIWLEDME